MIRWCINCRNRLWWNLKCSSRNRPMLIWSYMDTFEGASSRSHNEPWSMTFWHFYLPYCHPHYGWSIFRLQTCTVKRQHIEWWIICLWSMKSKIQEIQFSDDIHTYIKVCIHIYLVKWHGWKLKWCSHPGKLPYLLWLQFSTLQHIRTRAHTRSRVARFLFVFVMKWKPFCKHELWALCP